MKPLRDCQLYAFVDTAYLAGRSPTSVAQLLCDGGADLIQLRAKTASKVEVARLAEALLPITARAGVGLVINDYPEVAAATGAPLCHLGHEDFFDHGYSQVAELRSMIGIADQATTPLQVGLSTHAPDQARRALGAGADYIAIGPVFATPTKPTAKPVSLEYVRWAARHVTIPWFAIGGINALNLDQILEAGARRICVVSAILNADDPLRACQEFKNRIRSAGQTSL